MGKALNSTERAIVAKTKEIAARYNLPYPRARIRALEENPDLHRAFEAAHKSEIVRPNIAVPENVRTAVILEIQARAPEVLVALRNCVWRRPASERAGLIDTWASGFNLVMKDDSAPQWLLKQAAHTMKYWDRHPVPEMPRWGDVLTRPYVQKKWPIWVSIGDRNQSKAAMRRQLIKEARQQIEAILSETVVSFQLEHVQWFVRYQVCGESLNRIVDRPAAESYSVDAPAVKSAIRKISRVLRIALKPFGKPGRPRKPKT